MRKCNAPTFLCHLLITFANSSDPDQARSGLIWIQTGLIWIQTVCHSDGIPERNFQKSWVWKKQTADDKKAWKITQKAKRISHPFGNVLDLRSFSEYSFIFVVMTCKQTNLEKYLCEPSSKFGDPSQMYIFQIHMSWNSVMSCKQTNLETYLNSWLHLSHLHNLMTHHRQTYSRYTVSWSFVMTNAGKHTYDLPANKFRNIPVQLTSSEPSSQSVDPSQTYTSQIHWVLELCDVLQANKFSSSQSDFCSQFTCKTPKLNRCMGFPTVWHFDMCRLRRASAASF